MSAFTLNLADLEFILRQIKIAEANSTAHSGPAAIALTSVWVDANGNVVPANTPGAFLAIPDPHVPSGLRTVDGSFNNLVPGREEWGAADNAMPRLLLPGNADNTDGDQFDPDGPSGPSGTLTGGSYQTGGNIIDADPRTISNLVVDMSFNNPAAIVAALTFAGSEDIYGPTGDLADVQTAFTALKLVLDNPNATDAAKIAAREAFDSVLETKGISASGGSLSIPNIAPDEGLSAPFNAWMTFFGQFFDHGLDLIGKGGNGTVFVPLAADDPLVTHGRDGIAGTGDEVPAHLQFMTLTRATPVGGSQVNTTTPFVDQNQTYTSSASHQVFLREYELRDVGGGVMRPFATGELLDGSTPHSLPTWADVKAQARDILGINLTDLDVSNVPLLRTDAYGEFIRGPNGHPLLITGIGTDGIPNTDDDTVVEGNPGAPISTAGAVRTAHAFLDDIAHNAVPVVVGGVLAPDEGNAVGNAIASNPQTGRNLEYDNDLLDRHFITGDGRGNENIGLTAVHHIFHSEHNRQVEAQKLTLLLSGNLGFINEWLSTDLGSGTVLPTNLAGAKALMAQLDANGAWDGERLFQAARFATEMQYQHLVFEEFARKIQPAIDPFVFNNITDVNPAIFSEFANTVYRFGHSMLTDSMPRILLNADGSVKTIDDMGLIESFLNPVAFDNNHTITASQAAGAIVRGMTIERGNEIDEFVVNALRNNLLGLPLDLAAINIARGRDTNMPSLNEARTQLFGASGSTFLTPYNSWVEFAANLKNPASVINFIAAYGKHTSITSATTLEAKRAAASALVFGGEGAPADRIAFLNGTGTWTPQASGLNDIDLWIGGLAEKKMPFGGMLGSTFNAIFELQMENLQDGDRFYYLSRTQGQNLLVSLEQNSFAKLIMANTDIALPGPDGLRGTADDVITRHIGVDSFANYDFVLEVNAANQADQNGNAPGVDPTGNDAILEALGRGKVQRDDPTTAAIETNFLRFTGGEHIVVGGTIGNDTIITDFGDDGIWGDDGDDRIESGAGVDLVNGGGGNDIITDSGDTGDFLKGDEGDDVSANSNGIDILMGGSGQDAIFVGVDDTEVFAGQGNDFVLGGDGVDLLMGNEGDDWIEGGGGFDTIAGDNSELFFDSKIIGHDVMFSGNEEQDFDAESGDDIMVQGESVIRNEGMFGFDWAIYKDMAIAANADLRTPIFTTEQADILRNRFDKVEALSGWNKDDILRGDDRAFDPTLPPDAINANTENVFFNDGLDAAGLARISGLSQIVDLGPTGVFERGNVLLGGKGNDTLQGNGGDDVIDGDAWLNVRIRITAANAANTPANQISTVDSLRHVFTAQDAGAPSWIGKSLFELMVSRTIVPNQLHIVREILDHDTANTFVDTAVFNDVRANYTITDNRDGSYTITQNAVTVGAIDPVTGNNLISDGTDIVWNIERLQFADEVVEISPPTIRLDGFNSTLRALADNFNTTAFNNNTGTTSFATPWVEANDGTNIVNGGSIRIDGGTDVLQFTANNTSNATITRTLDLVNATAATATFSVSDIGVGGAGAGDNELIELRFAADGTNFVTVATFNGNNGGNNLSFNLPLTGPLSANAAIQFRAVNVLDTGESFSIDNLSISATITTPATPVATNITSTYTENQAAIPIASEPLITDNNNTVASARIVLTNASAGDQLVVPAAATLAPIVATTTAVGSTIVVELIGNASSAAYQRAIQSIGYRSTSEDPATTPRILEITVNDGDFDSNVATHTINVVSVNDLPNAINDTIRTNVVGGFTLPEWALLTNDVDLDDVLAITSATSTGGTGFTVGRSDGNINLTYTAQANRSFTYAVNDGVASDTATASLVFDGGNIAGTAAAEIIVGDGAASTITGAGGNDVIFTGGGSDIVDAGTGDDIIAWRVGDGRDRVDGGGNATQRGDTFRVDGDATNEAFVVYTRAAALAAGFTGLNGATEIVITRNGQIIAELDNIEEIIINTGGGTNSVTPLGNFGTTSLNFNTSTINGSTGNDTVDMSQLQSAHRVVFRSNGGQDTIIGTIRPQDVIELPDGSSPSDYTLRDNPDGTKSFVSGSHEIKFSGSVVPQLQSSDDDDEDESEDDGNNGSNNEDDDDNGASSGSDDDDEQEDDDDSDEDSEDDDDEDDESEEEDDTDGDGNQTPTPGPNGGTNGLPYVVYLGVAGTAVGRAGADVLSGSEFADALFGLDGDDSLVGNGGDDNIVAGGGNDLVFAGSGNDKVLAGAGNDDVFGDEGNDTIWGDAGNDRITAGAGNDVVDAGDGNDVIYATVGDGNDVYVGGLGTDTIDFQAITGPLTIKLGTSGAGSASSDQSGIDVLDGIENVKGGSGSDVIFASNAVNVMDGGAGNDTFVFSSAAAANGDRIEGFTTGDKIDLSPMFSQGETIVANNATFNLSGQIKLIFVNDDTRVEGNTDDNADIDFSFIVAGKHLTNTDFT